MHFIVVVLKNNLPSLVYFVLKLHLVIYFFDWI